MALGAHPRMGALDVCPFVPVSGVGMEECVELARKVGEDIARELGVPVYLYENAASRPERRSLADIRSGEYEALPVKSEMPDWKPRFRPGDLRAPLGRHSRRCARVLGRVQRQSQQAIRNGTSK